MKIFNEYLTPDELSSSKSGEFLKPEKRKRKPDNSESRQESIRIKKFLESKEVVWNPSPSKLRSMMDIADDDYSIFPRIVILKDKGFQFFASEWRIHQQIINVVFESDGFDIQGINYWRDGELTNNFLCIILNFPVNLTWDDELKDNDKFSIELSESYGKLTRNFVQNKKEYMLAFSERYKNMVALPPELE